MVARVIWLIQRKVEFARLILHADCEKDWILLFCDVSELQSEGSVLGGAAVAL